MSKMVGKLNNTMDIRYKAIKVNRRIDPTRIDNFLTEMQKDRCKVAMIKNRVAFCEEIKTSSPKIKENNKNLCLLGCRINL